MEKNDAGADSRQLDETIPASLINSLIRAKHLNRELAELGYLHFNIFHMAIPEPASHKEVKERNISKIFNSLRKDITGLDGPEVLDGGHDWGHYPASMDHLMGGYAAGLYFYAK
jgi:metallopeptidase MepB